MSEKLMTIAEVCAYLDISRSTWAKWRARGATPPVIRLHNGSLRVRWSDLDGWVWSLMEEVAG
jgi:predicted DNA-binding transcriptional regulator AlpA